MYEAAKSEKGARPRQSCPPHGPILVRAVEKNVAYVASCLNCGRVGPSRGDGWEAKLAFDELYGSRGPL